MSAMLTPRCRAVQTESGLTLIELCIAIALLSLIATMSYRGLDSMSRTSDRMLAEEERWQAVALFFERFGADVTQPALRPVRSATDSGSPAETGAAAPTPQARQVMASAGMQPGVEDHALPPWWGRSLPENSAADNGNAAAPAAPENLVSPDAQLEFTRKSPKGRDEVRLAYRLRGTRLELLVWHVLDRAPDSKPEVFTLLEGVSKLHFRHLDAAGVWQETWPVSGNNEPLPRAIEVEVTLNDDTMLRRVFALPS